MKKILLSTLFGLLLTMGQLKMQAQTITPTPFDPCSNDAFQVITSPSKFQIFNLATGGTTTLYTLTSTINAIGYNQLDNRVYGIIRNASNPNYITGLMVMGQATGTQYQNLTSFLKGASLPTGSTEGKTAYLGDINADGVMYVSELTGLWSIDLRPTPTVDYLRVASLGTLNKISGATLGPDIAFPPGPRGDFAYSVNPNGDLVKLNVSNRNITLVKANVLPNGSYGAVYFDNEFTLYASRNDGDNFKISNATSSVPADIVGSQFTHTNDTQNNNDGARCPNAAIPADFGDAPDAYKTLLASDGPFHLRKYPQSSNKIGLGAAANSELEGQPSINADKDLFDDGVSSFPVLAQGTTYPTYSVTVSVINTSGANAFLSGWIDWNLDSTFGSGEKVTVTVPNGATTATLTWTGQSTPPIKTGTYARFRISSVAGQVIDPTGKAIDGEVEDYFIPFYSIKGTVYHDPNGGTPDGTTPPAGLYAQLVDANNTVLKSVPVNNDGTYELPLLNGTLNVQITNVSGVVTASTALPTGYVHVSSTDATPFDGKTEVTSNFANITGVDFGIEQLPESDNIYVYPPMGIPVGRSFVLDGRNYNIGSPSNPNYYNLPPLSGSDPEDGTMGAGKSLKITTLPTNAQLTYNGVVVTTGYLINNYNPSWLEITLTQASTPNSGTKNIQFNYAYIDAANMIDTTPAIYKIEFPYVLPVKLSSFTVKVDNGDAVIDWSTSTEQNNAGYGVEHSFDGKTWNQLSFVNSKSANGISTQKLLYQYLDGGITIGTHYYRLKQTDLDGNFAYSDIVKVDNNSLNAAFKVYPNPTSSYIYIEYSGAVKTPIRIMDMNGRMVKTLQTTGAKTRVSTNELAAGTYVVSIDGKTQKFTVNK